MEFIMSALIPALAVTWMIYIAWNTWIEIGKMKETTRELTDAMDAIFNDQSISHEKRVELFVQYAQVTWEQYFNAKKNNEDPVLLFEPEVQKYFKKKDNK